MTDCSFICRIQQEDIFHTWSFSAFKLFHHDFYSSNGAEKLTEREKREGVSESR